jgi:glycosyltransferase involved in cell wall biosynthesis
LRVLFLSQIVPYPPHGGVLQRGYYLLRELGSRASVHLLAFVHPDALPTASTLEESRRALGEFCERVEYFPLWVKSSRAARAAALALSAGSPRPFSVIAHRSAAYRKSVSDALQGVPFDVVHVDTIALGQFVGDTGAVPTALTHHNIESTLMERRAQVEKGHVAGWYLRRESAKLREYERVTCPRFDVNIVVSPQDEAALLARIPGLRTAVVPNGVAVEYFTPDGMQETPALIYTGGMNMFANRDAVMYFLEEIWPAIRREVPQVRFFAVGQDPPADLRTIAAEDPQVVVTGYVDDIRPLVRQAAVYVVPLRVGGGTRLKVLDAMAAGKAIVSTSIGCEGIDLRPGEHLEVADTPALFVTKTLSLLRDRSARAALGRAARQLVERRYAWRVIGDRLMEAYGAAVEARRPRR